MQCSSVGCSLAQWKDIRPRRPEFGPEGEHFVSINSLFFILGGAAKLQWGARSARLACFGAQKDGCAQGAHARPKPTSYTYFTTEDSSSELPHHTRNIWQIIAGAALGSREENSNYI